MRKSRYILVLLLLSTLSFPAISQERGVIHGRVTDAVTGEPIQFGQVKVISNSSGVFYLELKAPKFAGGTLGNDGRFALVGLPILNYRLQVIALGYKAVNFSGDLDSLDSNQYAIPAVFVEVSLEPVGSISINMTPESDEQQPKEWILGRLIDAETSRPFANSRVNLLQNERHLRDVLSDEDGFFVFNEPAGTYRIRASKGKYLRTIHSVYTTPLEEILAGSAWARIELRTIESIADKPIGSIRVTAKGSGKILPGAEIILEDTGLSSVADSTGKFLFNNLVRGEYAIRVSMPGFHDFTQTVTINPPRSESPLPVNMVAELAPIVPTYRMIDVVTDFYTGLPVAGCQVRIRDKSKEITVSTDIEGIFFLRTIQTGRVRIQYLANGYRYEDNFIVMPDETSGTHVIDASIRLIQYNDEITRGFAYIKGSITDAISGFPASGVEVRIDSEMVKLRNDEQGNFSIEKLPRGSYNLSLFPDDFFIYPTRNGLRPLRRKFTIELSDPDAIDTVEWDIRLNPAAWIHRGGAFIYGNIIDNESGELLSDAHLLINPGIHQIMVDESARYQFYLPKENYKVQVTAPEYHLFEEDIHVNEVAIEARGKGWKYDFALNKIKSKKAKKSTLIGSVVDAVNGDPIYMADVFVLNSQLSAMTDIDGNYTIKEIPAGISAIEITAIGCMPYQTVVEIPKKKKTNELNVSLQPIRFTNHPMQLRYERNQQQKAEKYVYLEGSVIEKESQFPVSGSLVFMSNVSGDKDTLCVVTGTEGRFGLSVPEGKYDLWVQSILMNSAKKQVKLKKQLIQLNLQVELNRSKFEKRKYPPDGFTHNGVVWDLITRKPVDNAEVQLDRYIPDKPPTYDYGREFLKTDEYGRFQVEKWQLNYEGLKIWAEGFKTFEYSMAGIFDSGPMHILIEPGKPDEEKPERIENPSKLPLPPWIPFIEDDIAQPTPTLPFEIVLVKSDGKKFVEKADVKAYMHGLPGTRGRGYYRYRIGMSYDIPALRPGIYFVTVWTQGYKPVTTSLHYPYPDVTRNQRVLKLIMLEAQNSK